ncbi:hypothetical protein AB4874_05875 [Thioclava sp. 15-R06ZXC-3]|uniref:Translocase n=1 Tax=Thioclava arctica TaxID=3238301 RepID=A0ABV3THY0_9RHOB
MRKLQKVTLVAGTFLLAAATGHVMQSVSPDFSAFSPPNPTSGAMVTGLSLPTPQPRVQLSGMTVLHNPPTHRIAQDTGVGAIPEMPAATDSGFVHLQSTACKDASLDLSLVPPGAVSVALTAGCARNDTLNIHEGTLYIAAQADAEGNWQGLLPAMQAKNTISVHNTSGPVASGTISAPEFAKLDRVIFSADAGSEMHLNIYEKGAGFDGAGHVSVATPRTPDTPMGGFMMHYQGPKNSQIEVYTAPATLTPVRMQIETEVTPKNCNKTITGSIRRVIAGKSQAAVPIAIEMPDCEAMGQFVVLPLSDFQDARSKQLAQK